MIRIGKVSDIDHEKGYIRAEFPETGVDTDWMPIVVLSANKASFYAMPNIGDQVVISATDEYYDDCVCLGVIYSDNLKPILSGSGVVSVAFSDGTQLSYNANAKSLDIKAAGSITIKTDATLSVECINANIKATAAANIDTPQLTVGGNLTVNGQVLAAGDVRAASGAVGLLTHTHLVTAVGSPTAPPLG